jgi:ATP-dependent Lhr-like helicase
MNNMESCACFHPAVAAWFTRRFGAPTAAQSVAWPLIQRAASVLVAAPTGSGKTLAAFLAAIDALVVEGLVAPLPDETRVLYVSPLKALSNDIQRNLDAPLQGVRAELAAQGLPDVDIRAAVRTGDTPPAIRAAMRRKPPHILVTTPETLYILLGSESGRQMLASCRSVIVDEIHALAGAKRGAHLALSLERLEFLTGPRLMRIGLSATQEPIETVARFLVGPARPPCAIVDAGHGRRRDLCIELPEAPLAAVMSGEVWTQVYERLAALILQHRTTLVFVGTRRLAERVTRHLSLLLGEANVAAHHGSLAKERRLLAEQRLKRGELKAVVATASLELGIDIGDVDLVCQLGSPRSINVLLQRVGRAGHAVDATSKGRIFPLSRDELVECAALLDAVARGELDRLTVPENALDVLAQQITAEVSAQEWREDELYALVRRAHSYRALTRPVFDECVRMLAEGFNTRRGRRGALIHRDAVHGMLRPRRGSRLTAITSGGTIPDNADYQVLLEPEALNVGTVNEDFAVESLQGDVFQLGNTAYRILRVERGTVRVEDARGQSPSIPFWLGEAPGRSDALSAAVSRLRQDVECSFDEGRPPALPGLDAAARTQLLDYLAAGRAALGALPSFSTLVFERFFDESGGMQLIVHSPYGSRINRAWGLALRKRFCRSFNFELQAAATEDHIVLSLTDAHSFELEGVKDYLHSNSVRPLLVQALLAAPMFGARWRWNAGTALALPRFRGGRKVAPQIARMNAEDLLAAVFPEQSACAENLAGDIEIPDQPLVRQTLRDCLEEAMDVAGLEAVLRRIESGAVRVLARDLTLPSPLALEALNARPYAYLDDAPLEERRTQAVLSRRWMDPESAADIGRLDPEAIARVRAEAWPQAGSSDELHDALLWIGFLTDAEIDRNPGWPALRDELEREGRIAEARRGIWVAALRLRSFSAGLAADGAAPLDAAPREAAPREAAPRDAAPLEAAPLEAAQLEIFRGRLQALGPVTAAGLAAPLGLPAAAALRALIALESAGVALRGRFEAEERAVAGPAAADLATGEPQWCERGLLARIHRYTVKRLRAEIEPVTTSEYLRFLLEWQHVLPGARMRGPDALTAILGQLEGFDAPASAWESDLLPARIDEYEPAWLDDQCRSGRFVWTRLLARSPVPRDRPVEAGEGPKLPGPRASLLRSTPIALLARRNLKNWSALMASAGDGRGESETPEARADAALGSRARAALAVIRAQGASFFDEIADAVGLLAAETEDALAELVAAGLIHSDSFAGLRSLLVPRSQRGRSDRRRRRPPLSGMADAGRWALVRRPLTPGPMALADSAADTAIEMIVRCLLRRWGVIFWKLLARETGCLPPWRHLLACCRRLEARGEIRGGRFIAGLPGEQFATTEAVAALRDTRRRPATGQLVSVSGADPLNLIGILTPGPRLPSLIDNRLLYRDGLPIATYAAGAALLLTPLPAGEEWAARQALIRAPTFAPTATRRAAGAGPPAGAS